MVSNFSSIEWKFPKDSENRFIIKFEKDSKGYTLTFTTSEGKQKFELKLQFGNYIPKCVKDFQNEFIDEKIEALLQKVSSFAQVKDLLTKMTHLKFESVNDFTKNVPDSAETPFADFQAKKANPVEATIIDDKSLLVKKAINIRVVAQS